jgi:ABC-type Mn2+/Zn2+ transport system permease subunit
MLVGSILAVRGSEVLKVAGLYAGIGIFHWLCRRPFLLISTDPERAYRDGWRVRWWDFLFYASFGVVVTSSVRIAGVLLVFSYLIVPTLAANLRGGSVARRLPWRGASVLCERPAMSASAVFDTHRSGGVCLRLVLLVLGVVTRTSRRSVPA